MDVLFLIVALVGAVMAFGASLLRLFLEGVALINFVSAEDAIVFGVMLLLALANVGLWLYVTRRSKRVANARCASVISVSVIALAYFVLVMSIWADAWLKSYVAWCTNCSTMLTVLCVIGWLMMMAALGWFGHKLYIAITSRGAHAMGHVKELPHGNSRVESVGANTPVTPDDVEPSGRGDWIFRLDELDLGDEDGTVPPNGTEHSSGSEIGNSGAGAEENVSGENI